MKKYVFSILLVLFCSLASCQNSKSFGVWDYTIDSLPDERVVMFKYFSEVQHDMPYMFFIDDGPKARQINDTLFYIIQDLDTIYVYNTLSYQIREIPIKLDILPTGGIESIYYHNHDSIFLFYKQSYVQKPPQWIKDRNIELFDIVLINEQGDIIGKYLLDHPYKRDGNGNRNNTMAPYNRAINGTRLFDNELLIKFSPWPDCFSEEYAAFDPPIVALYNLKTGNCRMLNIHYPSECFGKTYGECKDNQYIGSSFWILRKTPDELFISFDFIPTIYHYDFQKDTMTKWDCKYGKVFTTTDSASMEYGKMVLKYDVPRWCSEEKCYFRRICIIEYKDYQWGTLFTEILDSNFNHLAYTIEKGENYNPYSIVGTPIVYYKKDKQCHKITFNRKLKKVKMSDFEKNMVKKPVPLKDSIGMAEYFHRLNIPDKRSVVLIANMKYPCGTCYDFIFSTMQYNRESFENNNIYCVCYDPNGTNFMDSYLEQFGLTDCKNIIKDTTMLGSVYGGFNYCFGNYPYILLQYMDDGKYTLEFPEFQTLHTMWGQLIKNQIEWKRKEE